MDYEKKYKEALENAKECLKDGGISQNSIDYIESIFPELKESGNIRIIKAIKYGLDYVFTNNTTVFEVTKEQCLAWLEKQGKNNMGISEATKKKLEDNLNKALEKETPESFNKFLDEQKPDWSKEDEDILNTIINHFKIDIECTDEDDVIRWLKSLRPQNHWKPSEEQMKCLDNVKGSDDHNGYVLNTLYNDLKKLREE